jgi:glycerophosphoryl diester phosphodiesterase
LDGIADLVFSDHNNDDDDDDDDDYDDKSSRDSQVPQDVSNRTNQKKSNGTTKKPTFTSLVEEEEDDKSPKPISPSLMTTVQEKVAMAQLRKLERQEKMEKMDEERQRIEVTLFEVNRLKEIHEKFPQMEDSDILNMFPDFQDIIQFVKKPSSSTQQQQP